MRKAIILSAVLAVVLVLGAASPTTLRPRHRVVFQMTEPQGSAWDELTVRVNNTLANFVEDGGVEIEIVFFGPGLNMLRKTNVTYEKRFRQFARYRVTFAACQNSMGAMRVSTKDLFPFASQVRSGVAEVIRKQEAGWAYIH